MLNRLVRLASACGAFLAIWMIGPILAPSAACASEPSPVRTERWDEAVAKAQATRLLPIIADDVIGGQRRVTITLPTGDDIGLVYEFRLRPQPVPYRPLCEIRTVALGYQFARRYPSGSISVGDFDLLEMNRAEAFKHEDLSVRRQYRRLSPGPRSDDEHAAMCDAVDVDQGWLDASDTAEFDEAIYQLRSLRRTLADERRDVGLRCLRDRESVCQVSAALILEIAEAERRDFSSIMLSDGTAWAQFTYYDDSAPGAGGEMRSIIIENRLNQIVSVTLVYQTMVPLAI